MFSVIKHITDYRCMNRIIKCLSSNNHIIRKHNIHTRMENNFTGPPKSKVELHVHLDGAVRPSTLIDVARRRKKPLQAKTAEELREQVAIKLNEGISLTKFLEKFAIFMPIIAGDEDAVRRIAYEWCEDSARQGIIYSEVRYSPHFLASPPGEGDLTPDRVVQLVCEGLEQGCQEFKTLVSSILCCIYQNPEWSAEVLDLCVKYKDRGVVGIDIAADEKPAEIYPTNRNHISVFNEAKKLGINRTVHAGEQGSIHNIIEAVEKMHAMRIGHGYKVVDDKSVYTKLNQQRMHFEMCPISSYCTGSIRLDAGFENHPLHRFIEDGVHHSISTDDPLLTGSYLGDEYQFVIDKLGATWADIHQANLYAAEASFLPDDEKKQLIDRLRAEYEQNNN